MTIDGIRSFSLGCLVLTALGLANTASRGAFVREGLYICAEHADPDDWDSEFANGQLVVPAGVVFDYAGHIIGGNFQDPRDFSPFRYAWMEGHILRRKRAKVKSL